ncbi:hypothetical protein ACQKRQ_38150 [Paraburkholderia sp. NPDC080076]|uniref:hypothetical protein n=1 Tax=Paraburkholderia sp. NPDC080076 TaxID=3390605 RepID=UPI003D0860F1
MPKLDAGERFAFECHIRDYFAANLQRFRPNELVSKCEVAYRTSRIRADLRTINQADVIFEWEFKIEADYSAIGQVMAYSAYAKIEFDFKRTVRPVIAAFRFPEEIRKAIEVNNLGIEIVQLPASLRAAGALPHSQVMPSRIEIPRMD